MERVANTSRPTDMSEHTEHLFLQEQLHHRRQCEQLSGKRSFSHAFGQHSKC